MPKERSQNRDKAFEIYKEHKGDIKNREIAKKLNISEKTVSSWKFNDKWNEKINKVLCKNNQSTLIKHRKKGGQPKNQNAVKHGLFSKYLPDETLEIFNSIEQKEYIDLLWDNIQIQYAAILRSQKIMYISDKNDITKETVVSSQDNEKYEIQQAWDKQANFLNAQSRAMSALQNMIKQYDELIHKNWELATEEQKTRIDAIKDRIDEKDKNSSVTVVIERSDNLE